MTHRRLVVTCLAALVLLTASYAFAAQVHLAWNASSGSVTGYRIYYGTSPGSHPTKVEAGNVTDYIVTGLSENVMYYFVVRAYNSYGESADSNEISWISTSTTTTVPPTTTTTTTTVTPTTTTTTTTVRPTTTTSTTTTTTTTSPTTTTTTTLPPPQGSVTKIFGSTPDANYPGTCADTFINSGSPTTNYSTNTTTLNTYTWPANTPANRIVMKWDLSAIPKTAVIQRATLSLYMYGYEETGGDNNYEISVHKIVNRNPVIASCTWNTYNGTSAWSGGADGGARDIAPQESSTVVNKTAGYKSWDVSKMVQDWVSTPSSNFGLMLNSDSTAASDSNRMFRPTEYATASQRPKLTVTYTEAPGKPGKPYLVP